jgi:hypothetical protein
MEGSYQPGRLAKKNDSGCEDIRPKKNRLNFVTG